MPGFLFGYTASDYARMSDFQLGYLWLTYGQYMCALERLYVSCEIEARMRFAGWK